MERSCIKDYCGFLFESVTPEERAKLQDDETLVAFWFMYCQKHRRDGKVHAHIIGQVVNSKGRNK